MALFITTVAVGIANAFSGNGLLVVAMSLLAIAQIAQLRSRRDHGMKEAAERTSDAGVPWRASLKILHVGLLVVILLYLVMVAVNAFAFDYSFWNDPPPNSAANAFAVVSIGLFFLAAGFVGAVAYTWLCAHELDPAAALGDALLAAARSTGRRWFAATIGFVVTALGCFFIVPGPLLVAWLAAVPVRRLWEDGWALEERPSVAGTVTMQTGLVVTGLVAVPSWLALQSGFALADNWDGVVQAVAALLAYAAIVVAGVGAGWAARKSVRAST